MNIFKTSNNNLDELVFENRNKTYGAYVLRSNYEKNLKRSFFITFFVPLVIILLSVIYNKLHGDVLVLNPVNKDNANDSLIITVVEFPKKEEVKAIEKLMENPQKLQGDNRNYSIRNIHENVPALSDTFVTHVSNTGSDTGGNGSNETIGSGSVGGSDGLPNDLEGTYDFNTVEVLPEFNGDLYAYLGNEIDYPMAALANGVHGKVLISFVVNANGNITDVQILNSVGFGCDEEAMRVVKNMPNWSAGMQNNQKVNVRMVLPIMFEIGN